MRFPRSSGILCHITSLPSELGIGDLGSAAYQMVDFLHAAGQSIWQILPLSPPAYGDSPYSAYSAFAGNPLLISLETLVEEGLLDAADLEGFPEGDPAFVNYGAVHEFKLPKLRVAYERFCEAPPREFKIAFELFIDENDWWLDEFSLFEVFMNKFEDSHWANWPDEIRRRDADALGQARQELSREIDFSRFKQFLFERQWNRLKAYANQQSVQLCGDMPIFVAYESADVWGNQDMFALNEDGTPKLVAGVPPDYFSETGQLWGNPQYDWDALEGANYAWWTARFRRALQQFDLLRVDHFRGFEAYWEIRYGAETAIDGQWKTGPGTKPFDAATKELGELPFIAEDLGMITDSVHELREKLGFPGMRVLQFGFATMEDDFHRPSTYTESCVAYTGTHDNDTVMGWYHLRKPPEEGPDPLDDVIHGEEDIHWQLIDAVMSSEAEIAIVPIQDVLGLGNEARMNLPGVASGNWAWRLKPQMLTMQHAERLASLCQQRDRLTHEVTPA
ncbi:4-alpha-glucanotransferase [Rhodopirellula halodulae]|uniref:4-alpha-glucanotransferase n=1 Tax=Rhodopirellula halodulae TaxID=2894198 RepID=UPI001E6108D2|nr:4-alpha-glucanotransferase [Rhodopirellula sp. JC737]MCC9654930.1 4-alpha-glucanotransferase [Rhodopirellula sp. JC737]